MMDQSRERHVNSHLDANDSEVGLPTHYSSSAMAVEVLLRDARSLLALSIPRVDIQRYQADV